MLLRSVELNIGHHPFAHLHSIESFEEGVRHPSADDHLINLVQQVFDKLDFVVNLCPTKWERAVIYLEHGDPAQEFSTPLAERERERKQFSLTLLELPRMVALGCQELGRSKLVPSSSRSRKPSQEGWLRPLSCALGEQYQRRHWRRCLPALWVTLGRPQLPRYLPSPSSQHCPLPSPPPPRGSEGSQVEWCFLVEEMNAINHHHLITNILVIIHQLMIVSSSHFLPLYTKWLKLRPRLYLAVDFLASSTKRGERASKGRGRGYRIL